MSLTLLNFIALFFFSQVSSSSSSLSCSFFKFNSIELSYWLVENTNYFQLHAFTLNKTSPSSILTTVNYRHSLGTVFQCYTDDSLRYTFVLPIHNGSSISNDFCNINIQNTWTIFLFLSLFCFFFSIDISSNNKLTRFANVNQWFFFLFQHTNRKYYTINIV